MRCHKCMATGACFSFADHENASLLELQLPATGAPQGSNSETSLESERFPDLPCAADLFRSKRATAVQATVRRAFLIGMLEGRARSWLCPLRSLALRSLI